MNRQFKTSQRTHYKIQAATGFILLAGLVLAFMVLGAISGCAGLPPKPKGIIWSIDVPRAQLIGAPIGGVDPNKLDAGAVNFYVEKKGTYKMPLDQADKFLCFSPDTWNAVDSYVKQLREIASRQCNQGTSP